MKKIILIILLFTLHAEAQTIRSLAGVTSSSNSASAPVGDAPVNTAIPVISDATPKVGEEVTVTNGTWTNSPTSFSYQWSRDGLSIAGATLSSYTPTSSDYNLPLGCVVTATNGSGSTNASATVTANVLPANPVNTIAPLITGTYQSGQTLTCSQGTWTGQGTLSYAYQWKRNGTNIGGATSSTYLTTVTDEETTLTCTVTSTNAGGSTAITTDGAFITNPSLSVITSNHVYSGSDRMLIYTPPGYSNNTNDYPVLLVYHGNGERGVPSDNNYLAGTGNGSQTVFSGNLNNTEHIIHSSVYVQVNGVTVGTGRRGVITGDEITGTYTFDNATSNAFSITFTTAPTSGHQVRVYYTQCVLMRQQYMRYLNLGDEPDLIVVAPQISRASGGFTTTEWDNPLDYLIDNGYRIDTDRIYVTGFSLGGDMCDWVNFNANPGTNYSFAAYVAAAPGSTANIPSSGAAQWTAGANKGKLYVRGTSDPNGTTKVPSVLANCNGGDLEMPAQALMYWNVNHTPLPDTYVYNRRNRTDATGTAHFDFIEDFLMKYSLDAEQQASLFVDYAELTQESQDYRLAERQVNNLSASATKTALLADLATLKTSIGNSVLVDFGGSFYNSSGNYNNVNSSAAATTLANLIDDTGTNTGWTYTTVTPPAASPSLNNDIGVTRLQGKQFGTVRFFTRDGMLIDAAGTTGTLKFSGLNNAKTYRLKIYVGASNSAWSSRAEVETVAGGVTKYKYCDTTNFNPKTENTSGAFIEYTSLTPSSGEISFTIKTRLTANTERASYLQGLELIENP